MGWKNVKEYYRIGHIVSVDPDQGICIGSSYIHNIIVVGLNGQIKRPYQERGNADLSRYMEEMTADLTKLKALIDEPDMFERSLPVYTYEDGQIVEKSCEEYGWPNVTHDGILMYANTFSEDREKVKRWAIKDAQSGLKLYRSQLVEARKKVQKYEMQIEQMKSDIKGYLQS